MLNCFSTPVSSSSPDSFRVLQRNAGGLFERVPNFSTLSRLHSVCLIYVQQSNLNSPSSFRIPGYCALRSDCNHSWFDILFPDDLHANGDVIIFVRQKPSFCKLSTSSVSSLELYSDYVGIIISLNNFSLLSFLYIYAPPICSSSTNSRTESFSPSVFPSRSYSF